MPGPDEQCSGASPARINAATKLWTVILPILAADAAGDCHVLGTGFVVVGGRRALLVTAAHVMREVRRVERPRERHHASAFFVPAEYRFELKRTRPFVLYQHPTAGVFTVAIEGFLEIADADLALCRIQLDEDVPPEIAFAQLVLDTRPVDPGEEVVAFGYTAGSVAPTDDVVDGSQAKFTAQRVSRPGKVTDVYPVGGPTGQKGACFQCSAQFDPGMSGGPVLSNDGAGRMAVRGVVMSDWQLQGDRAGAGALATAIWQLLLMPVDVPQADGRIGKRSLLELERERAIEDLGRGSAHVVVVRGENGQVVSARWE